ncbi:Rap family tetratricopeptide repeat protein [Bacillus chungangensis]|uniref:Tetratricopeptide (TPR) repeat protein n=1 Tax=Bacillus chungangensis TaxID=587633 RepID=A0ABT9WNX0_9BACI|nr:Rap family tetratricopeptide repeat protein [Bacillus chungangensis]MDQ0174662.1 tetratricopeptide (TPR) repeat protein [Bacillus chungangensis]
MGVIAKEDITKLLNDWYVEIRSHHVIKARKLKEEIDKKINNIEPDQEILIYYSLLDFRYKILIEDFEHHLNEELVISEDTNKFLQYYYHFFKFIYATGIGNYSNAKKHCEYAEKLLESIPDEAEKAEFNYRASVFYYLIDQCVETVNCALKAKQFFSKNPGYEVKLAASENMLGMAYTALREFHLAEKHLIASINILQELDEKSLILKVNYNLGLLYADQNFSELAIRYLSESFEDEEKDYKTMFLLAREYFKIVKKEEVTTYIEKGLKVCNKEYIHHFNILKALNDQLPIEQLEEITKDAIEYFKSEDLWHYVKNYAKELAIGLFDKDNYKKSSGYFILSYKAEEKLLERGKLK